MKRIIILGLLLMPNAAQAEFLITSAVLEFTKDSPAQQDIEIVSRSKTDEYLVAEVAEVLNPGTPQEERRVITDPSTSRLLVTPDKTILSGGGRKTVRFVLLHPLDAQEHIYRVAIKPVIKGLENNNKVGLKILIGYEVLVIIRPQEMAASYTAQRSGAEFTVNNTGNTNILFNNGSQCLDTTRCKMPPVLRVYPYQQVTEILPLSNAVTYAVWDGKDTIEKKFD